MKPATVGLLLGLLIPAGASAAEDPAVTACEAMLYASIPPNGWYERSRAVIVGDVVVVGFLKGYERGIAMPTRGSCSFALDTSRSVWTLVRATLAQATVCRKTLRALTDRAASQTADAAAFDQPSVQRCRNVLRVEDAIEANRVSALDDMEVRGAYPIAAAATALRSLH